MMGRIIYKGRSVSHIYLWVAIAFWELSAATPPASENSPSFAGHPGTKLYWEEEGSRYPFSIHMGLSYPSLLKPVEDYSRNGNATDPAESDNPRNGTIAIKKSSHRSHFAGGPRGFRKLL
jgi:hypothetical protein